MRVGEKLQKKILSSKYCSGLSPFLCRWLYRPGLVIPRPTVIVKVLQFPRLSIAQRFIQLINDDLAVGVHAARVMSEDEVRIGLAFEPDSIIANVSFTE